MNSRFRFAWCVLLAASFTILFAGCHRAKATAHPQPAAAQPAAAQPLAAPTAPTFREPYPEIEPFDKGFLRVSAEHEIYYELCGNKDGIPVMILHGGPGGGSYPQLRRYHDPARYLLVLHDQRGAGKSKPHASLNDNNTPALVEDMEKLRQHLALGKIHLFGGSWGSTLALAYAQTYPQYVDAMVIRGVFMATQEETDHFYHGGIRPFFPEAYEGLRALVPRPDEKSYPRQLLAMLQSSDAETRKHASYGWARYEMSIAQLEPSPADIDKIFEGWDPYDFSLIENHYMANHCFLKEGQLLTQAERIRDVPTIIVQGRYDMVCPPVSAWELHRRLPKSQLHMVTAGHSGGDPSIRTALLNATDELAR